MYPVFHKCEDVTETEGIIRLPESNVPADYLTAEQAFTARNDMRGIVSKDGDVHLSDGIASVRKVLLALIAWEFKQDVWETEYVEITQYEKDNATGEFESDLEVGETLNWKDVVGLMLVPSWTDLAALVTRVIGNEIVNTYGIGQDFEDAIGIWMSDYAVQGGSSRTFATTGNRTSSSSFTSYPVIASPRDIVCWIKQLRTVPELAAYTVLTSYTANIQSPTPRTTTGYTVSWMIGGYDLEGNTLGERPANYLGSKTGDTTTTGIDGHGGEVFAWEAGSGEVCYGYLSDSKSRPERGQDVRKLIMQSEAVEEGIQSGVTSDPYAAQTVLNIFASDPPEDSSPSGRTVESGVVSLESSNYYGGQSLEIYNSYVRVPNPPDLTDGDFCVEVYMEPSDPRVDVTDVTGAFELINVWDSGADQRSWAVKYQNGSIVVLYSTDGETNVTLSVPVLAGTAGGSYNANGINHYCLQRTGGDLDLYLNGQLIITSNIGSTSFHSGSADLYIGARHTTGAGVQNYFGLRLLEAKVTLASRYNRLGFIPRFYRDRY